MIRLDPKAIYPIMMAAPSSTRDCLDCGAKDGMKLQNVAHTAPISIPLLYVCQRCGTQLTVPPAPITFLDLRKYES
jgi:DNA-directed RNA polymerase subunit RPC12/RpoP